MSTTLKVGFLGCGRMATAMAKGFLRSNLLPAGHLVGSDPVEVARTTFARETGGRCVEDNGSVLGLSEVVILAVKPDQAMVVLDEIRSEWQQQHLLVSVVAGLSLERMESCLGGETRVVRAMPNTPAMVGMSATGYAMGRYARPEDMELAGRLFAAVGMAVEVKEQWLEAITGLSGSGPAYACLMIEALSDGGVAEGLPRDTAMRLAAQTLMGSAAMVLQTGSHPALLREMVTSPGGTTIEGLRELEDGRVRAALTAAVRAAARKARRLGRVRPAHVKRGTALAGGFTE